MCQTINIPANSITIKQFSKLVDKINYQYSKNEKAVAVEVGWLFDDFFTEIYNIGKSKQ